ncbi:SDR family NAD(P)-dependent oxidoreductase [Spirosoma aureum]|uniref:SDR family NAD(P)-dependent oxidoreductase n=1 Tax=Spirosoma aureum TaxID=2692134 RepID=A0A6G9AQG3_9BACT|nr:SDR family NAD(P)-dependent oxidoreductase [Spirosoma aureum]QIP14574.1 SDR family NAD(P)-dependent oxidoreductase [Spirosoma aureum]
MDNRKVWFITGASKGLGLSLVRHLLAAGEFVAATSRNRDALIRAIGAETNQFLPMAVDLNNEGSVADAIQQTTVRFGRVDVVVNNAGYGIGGSIEELTDQETRESFAINVFGMLNVIRAVLPQLRKQHSGHIINISSIAGLTATTGWAIYGATKYAVVGLSEVLAADVRSFGIKVTVVAPGAFRTSFLSAESLVIASNPIDAYQDVRVSHARYRQLDGLQAGDPEKAAMALIQLAAVPDPPLYLLLGSDAYERAFRKLDNLREEFKRWEGLTQSTDFETRVGV